MSYLPARIDNSNKARRLFDILMSQRKEMIDNIRFNLLLKASTINRSEQSEVDSYNKQYEDYIKLIYPTKDKSIKDEAKRMFAPWKKFFEGGPIINIVDIEAKLAKKKESIEVPPVVKNLTKTGTSASLLIPKKR